MRELEKKTLEPIDIVLEIESKVEHLRNYDLEQFVDIIELLEELSCTLHMLSEHAKRIRG